MEEKGRVVTICGFGSLMSQASARRTFPSLRNFRAGKVEGFARVFRLVSVSCILHGYANPDRDEYATCAATRRDGSHLLVTLFDVDPDELPAFYEREHRLRIVEVDYEELLPQARSSSAEAKTGRALLCTEYSDDEYIAEKCGGSQDEYRRRVGRLYTGKLWRNDILPARFYLSLCLRAARSLGEEFVVNFLEASFLGDGETSVRDYLARQSTILHPRTLAVDDEEMERIRACQSKRTAEETARDNYAVQMTEIGSWMWATWYHQTFPESRAKPRSPTRWKNLFLLRLREKQIRSVEEAKEKMALSDTVQAELKKHYCA